MKETELKKAPKKPAVPQVKREVPKHTQPQGKKVYASETTVDIPFDSDELVSFSLFFTFNPQRTSD